MRAIREIHASGAAVAVGIIVAVSTVCSLSLTGGSAEAAPASQARPIASHSSTRTERHPHRHRHRRHRHRRAHGLLRAPMLPAVASWYYDGGGTACGFHAQYGVANRSLPCGTHVRLRFGARSVVATVDDRGPFVTGRTYDLDQTTASALGMWGVATVYTAVV